MKRNAHAKHANSLVFVGFKHISNFDVFCDFAILNGAVVLQYVLEKYKNRKTKNKQDLGNMIRFEIILNATGVLYYVLNWGENWVSPNDRARISR